jgi:hypothetical protein
MLLRQACEAALIPVQPEPIGLGPHLVRGRKGVPAGRAAPTRADFLAPLGRKGVWTPPATETGARLADGAGDLEVLADEDVVRPTDLDLVDCVQAVAQVQHMVIKEVPVMNLRRTCGRRDVAFQPLGDPPRLME